MKECPKCKREWEDKVLFCPLDGQPLVEKVVQDPFIGVLLDNKYRLREKIGEMIHSRIMNAAHHDRDGQSIFQKFYPECVASFDCCPRWNVQQSVHLRK